MFVLLFALASILHAAPPLRPPGVYKLLPKACQDYFVARDPATMIERAFMEQYASEHPRGPLLVPMRVDRRLAAHWRILSAWPMMQWRHEGEGVARNYVGRVESPVGPMRAKVSCSIRHNAPIWVSFDFPDEPSSRTFFAHARAVYDEVCALIPLGARNAPTKVFPFDPRDGSVYIILGNEYDDLDRSPLDELDRIAEFNGELARRLFTR